MSTRIPLRPIDRKVLELIDKYGENIIAKDIAKKLNITKGYVTQITKKLEKLGLIRRLTDRPATYELTPFGRSLLYNRGSVFRVDALRVWLRVVGLGGGVRDWLEGNCFNRSVMRGWVKYFLRFSDGVHVEVNLADRNPSVEVVFDRFWGSGGELFGGVLVGRVFRTVWMVINWLGRNGIIVDPESMRVSNQEFESPVPDALAKNIGVGVHRVNLGRKALGLTGEDLKQDAVAWLDLSPGYHEWGTNDLSYESKLLLMPEVTWGLNKAIRQEFIPAVREYTKQIQLHLEVLRKMEQNQEKMNQLLEKLLTRKTFGERLVERITHLIKKIWHMLKRGGLDAD